MAKFSDNIQSFFEVFGVHYETDTVPIPRTASRFRPGNLIIFSYPGGGQRMAIVVSNKRGSGVFVAKKNQLVSSFKLDDVSSDIIQIILQNLYKKERKASYSKIVQSLKTILGSDRYRTYTLSKMMNVFDIKLNPGAR